MSCIFTFSTRLGEEQLSKDAVVLVHGLYGVFGRSHCQRRTLWADELN